MTDPGAEAVASNVGGILHGLASALHEAGASMPEPLVIPTEPASAIGAGQGAIVAVNQRRYYASSRRFGKYRAVATIVDDSWVVILAPSRTNFSLISTTNYRSITSTGRPGP